MRRFGAYEIKQGLPLKLGNFGHAELVGHSPLPLDEAIRAVDILLLVFSDRSSSNVPPLHCLEGLFPAFISGFTTRSRLM